jgi:hypothetical protein
MWHASVWCDAGRPDMKTAGADKSSEQVGRAAMLHG